MSFETPSEYEKKMFKRMKREIIAENAKKRRWGILIGDIISRLFFLAIAVAAAGIVSVVLYQAYLEEGIAVFLYLLFIIWGCFAVLWHLIRHDGLGF